MRENARGFYAHVDAVNVQIDQIGQRDAAREVHRAAEKSKHARRWGYATPTKNTPAPRP